MAAAVAATAIGAGGYILGRITAPTDTAAADPSPSIWQDTRDYPDSSSQTSTPEPTPTPTPSGAPMGKKVTNGSATVVVEKVYEADTARTYDDKTKKAGEGAKYVLVDVTVYNDGSESFTPACAQGISDGVMDADGRTFDAVYDLTLSRDQDNCQELQPGFKERVTYVARMPKDATAAQWLFSGDDSDTSTAVTLNTKTTKS
ncbi:DUF4352 domain-containing protein [Streptomyces sp. P9(2023)]|uniref:DUF4352 domain-containing protein n=1 Tax=Streptomyces sp. P9(2023) TaxID=3064394 RepID=UPI0028F4344F|nr:DUF4352 domain-containing protein [Streptomyces sp. P9(2023)]MDT9688846.1 DUF4352 domain-containing protein [Streptomyces sp. P9(2023)]